MFDTLSIFSDNGAVYKSNVHKFFSGGNLICQINSEGVITDLIQSENASESRGYRIFNKGGKYVLEVDSIVVREGLPNDVDLLNTIYYKNQNVIISVRKTESDKYRCLLKYNNTYKSGD
jgi:hypothetical protein